MDVHGPYVCPEPYDKEFANDVYPNNDLEVVPDTRPIGGIPEFQVLGPVRDSNGSLLEYHKNCGYYYSQYDGCIRYVDDIIGRLLAKLKESNIYDDCLLIITSDHGEAFGENNIFLYHGLTVTPEQISVPLIIKPHKDWNICHDIIEKPVSTIDIMPTLLSLCCPQDYDIGVDGISLKTLIEEKSDKAIDDRTLLSENETSFALIYPNKIMEMRKRDAVISNYFTHAPELIDSLNGKKYRWDTGKII